MYCAKYDYAKAKELYTKAVTIEKRNLDECHLDVSRSYENIGNACFEQGDYEKAMDYFEESLIIKLQLLGESDVDVADLYDKLIILVMFAEQMVIMTKRWNVSLKHSPPDETSYMKIILMWLAPTITLVMCTKQWVIKRKLRNIIQNRLL